MAKPRLKKNQETKESAHTDLSPSNAERWLNCPGSVALCASCPRPEQSEHAAEGEAAHKLLERTLKEGIDGFYSEIVVVMDEQAQSLFRILSDLFFRKMGECGMYLYQILV